MRRSGFAFRLPAACASAGGYLLLALILLYPLPREFGRSLPGDAFDGWQNLWNLWWIKNALLVQHTSPYFTNLLYAPTGVSLLFQTLNPFNGYATLPVQLAWGLFPAYNSAVLFSFAAGGYGAYLLARQTLGRGSSRLASFAAGFIFTFAPYHLAHLLGHLQLIALEWIPFYALYVVRLVGADRRRPGSLPVRDALLAGLFLILVGLCDWYYVLYCLILTALALVWAAWRGLWSRHASRRLAAAGFAGPEHPAATFIAPSDGGWTRQARAGPGARFASALAGSALAVAVFGLVLSPVLAPMVREAAQSRYMVPDPAQSRLYSADLLGFILPQEFHPLWGAWARQAAQAFVASLAEHQVFAGYTVLLLAALGIRAGRGRRRRSVARPGLPPGAAYEPAGSMKARPAMIGLWVLSLLVFFVLSLGPVLHVAGRSDWLPGGGEIHLPYGWLARTVPFLDISRSVSRFDVMVMLALAMLAALGLQWLVNRRAAACPRLGRWLAAGAAVLILFEFWPAPYPFSAPDTPAWYQTLAADPRPGAVLNVPLNWDPPNYLLYQTVHQKPLIMGYISREDPRGLAERAPVLQQLRNLGPDIISLDPAGQGRQILFDLGVRWVVLDYYQMPGEPARSFNRDMARLLFGSQKPAFQDDRLTVYEVSAGAAPGPYIILGPDWQRLVVSPGDGQRSRAFVGQGTLAVYAPAPAQVELRVSLARDGGCLAVEGNGVAYALPLQLAPGANEVVLRACSAGETVSVAALELTGAAEAGREGMRLP